MMKNLSKFFILMTAALVWVPNAMADTNKIDNIAACAGVVIGNGAIDYFIGDEASFDDASDLAYTAYLSEVFANQYAQTDIQIADQILAGNVDKVIVAYNSETFDNELYEEIVGCYRMLSVQLLEQAETIVANEAEWQDIKNTLIMTVKRMLSAGQ